MSASRRRRSSKAPSTQDVKRVTRLGRGLIGAAPPWRAGSGRSRRRCGCHWRSRPGWRSRRRELARGGGQRVGMRGRNEQHAVVVADHDVARVHHVAVDAHLDVDFAGSVLERTTVGHAARVAGEAVLAKRGAVADRAVDHGASQPARLGDVLHDVADQRAIDGAAAIDHRVARACNLQRLVGSSGCRRCVPARSAPCRATSCRADGRAADAGCPTAGSCCR